jgi:hypothetical protein
MSDLIIGNTLLSRFSLLEMIGEGGMGQVWRVWDLELEIQIAIKIYNPRLTSNPDHVELLKNECRNTRRLIHPNIVRVFDFHRSEDLAFISMEYIEGEDLVAYRSRLQHPNATQIIKLLQPIIKALAYAHELGLVHRDVKASNILLDAQQTPRLTDFGIAGVFKSGDHSLKITSGGSLYCMSPQQLDGRPPRPSDDIYALGVLLHELFTGYPPFYPDITRDKILHEVPARLNQRFEQLALNNRIPERLENLIAQMLAKTPDQRPLSMPAIDTHLAGILNTRADPTLPPELAASGAATQKPPAPPAQIITPVSVRGKTARRRPLFTEQHHWFKGVALVFAFVFLVAGGIWLWHFLANRPPGRPAAPQAAGQQKLPIEKKAAALPKDSADEAMDPAKLAAAKKEAEQKLAEFMPLTQQLEEKGVSQWGNPAYAEMTRLAQAADRFFIEQDYSAATEKYAQAAAQARGLIDQIEPTLKRLLQEGRQAFEAGDSQQAQEKFNVALMIDPNNALAQHSLQRAKNMDAVKQLLASGSRHETDGKIALAHADYQKAVRLDPESKAAQQALARVKGQINDAQFQQLMSEGLAAFHDNNYKVARAKLLKAKSYRPNSREVNDALVQVDQSIRRASIEAHRKNAAVAENSENWEQALNAYLQVLEIDKNVQFAAQGKQRALTHIRLEKRINFFLQQPAALQSDAQLENAIQLIQQVNGIKPKGPRLTDQLNQLTQLVDAAQTPVKIILESDNFTEVAVYKVGKLGRFTVRELNLRPGTYTLVGARDGYQDVRKKIIVKPGQRPMRIAVKCEVKI